MQRNFKKFAKFAVLCGLAVGLMAHPAFATDAPVRTTEKVVVTAGRIAEKAKTVTQNVTVIDEEMIQKNQHKSLDQLLQQQGIQINGYSGDSYTPMEISLRGQRSTADDPNEGGVMILVNGQRTSITGLNMIPMVSIQRIEVLRGPAAVQYGSMAFGGIVNIITKRGAEQTQASIEVGGGSWESWKTMAGVSGMVGDFDYAVGFSHSMRNGNMKAGDGHEQYNTEVGGMTSYYANFGYTFAEEHRIGVNVIGSNFDRMGNNSGTNYYKTPNGVQLHDYADRKNYAIGLSYEGGAKDYGLSWVLKYNNSNDEHACYGSWYSGKEFKNQNAQAQVSWKYNFLTLTGGVDWNKAEAENLADSIEQYELSNISSFLLAKAAFFDDKLVFSVGARYDDYTFKVKDERSDDNFSLNAGVAVSPWDWLTFRANVGEAFRMPTGIETVGYKGDAGTVLPNPDLKPESGLGWDFGFETQYKGFKAGLTYFSMDYEDKIVSDSQWSQDANGNWFSVSQFRNASGTTKFRGIEGNISYDLGEAFNWDFMLRPYVTVTHMLDYKEADGTNVPKVRDWVTSFGVNYANPAIGLDVDLSCTYLGKQRDLVDYTFEQVFDETGDKYIVDLSIIKTLYETDDMGKFSAKLDLRNITDELYDYAYGYPMPGRSFFLSLIWNY